MMSARLTGCSLLALTAAMIASPQRAAAQAFQGTGTTTFGSATITTPTTTTTNITVNSPRAVINWTPTDSGPGPTPITFLPAGSTASFIAGTGAPGGQFTVLNRIIPAVPSRQVYLNGTVGSTPGGKIWFYSPGGLLIGANASFNVGGLLLSSHDFTTDVNGDFMPTGNSFSTFSPAGNTSGVNILPGAQFTMAGENSYLIAIGPAVDYSGTANINGSTALVAAEAVNMTMNQGLFDIQVTVGTDTPDFGGGNTRLVVNEGGSITGPASSGAGDQHMIYMVAVPKNDALTLMIDGAGAIGFAVAGAADVVGNQIVLSAGYNVGNPAPSPFARADPAPGTGAANLSITGGTYTSRIRGRGKSSVTVNSGAGNMIFESSATFSSAGNTSINVGANASITAADFLSAQSGKFFTGTTGQAITAGNSTITVGTNGVLSVGGLLNVNSTAIGDDNAAPGGTGGAGNAGNARLILNPGASVDVGGAISVISEATGGNGATGGVGTAGQAQISIDNGAALESAAGVSVSARGTGGIGSAGAGGAGFGGTALFTMNPNASLNVATDLEVYADGFGGNGTTIGGLGDGGSITVGDSNNATIEVGDQFIATADGVGGTGNAGGNGVGGATNIGFASVADFGGLFYASADAVGGNGAAGAGGNATAGNTNFTVNSNAAVTVAGLMLDGKATGGTGTGGAGGNATGGLARVFATANGDLFSSTDITLNAFAVGGAASGGAGGQAVAGIAELSADAAGTGVGIGTDGDLLVYATATGGNATNGNAGLARGGQAVALMRSGTLTVDGGIELGAGAQAGSATGTGNGGNATAGRAELFAQNATIQTNGTVATGSPAFPNAGVLLRYRALAGNGAGGGAGGSAFDFTTQGFSSLTAGINTNSSLAGPAEITTLSALITADAVGGAGGANTAGSGGAGGAATASSGSVFGAAGNGVVNIGTLIVSASATGGAGGGGTGPTAAGGAGGAANGGVIQVGTYSGLATPDNDGAGNYGNVFMTASATGGAGGSGASPGSGGFASGGGATLLSRGSPVTAANVQINVAAAGGNTPGGINGGATAGGAGVLVSNRFQGTERGSLTAATIIANTNATRGTGGTLGVTYAGPGSVFEVIQGDVSASSVNFALFNVDQPGVPTNPNLMSRLHLNDGDVAVGGFFTFANGGNMAVTTQNNGALTAGDVIIQARNFVVDPTVPAPGTAGLITGTNTLQVISQNNVIVRSNVATSGDVNINAPGLIQILNISALDEINLIAGGSVTTGDLAAEEDIAIDAVGAVAVGNVRGDEYFDVTTGGNFTAGTISVGDGMTAEALGNIQVGAIDAGRIGVSTFPGADYSVGLVANGSTTTGAITAAGGVGLGSNTGTVTAGNITADEGVLILSRNGVTTGNLITLPAGEIYVADASMYALLGPGNDPTPILNTTPVRLTGPVSIGAASTNRLRVATTGNVSFGGPVSASIVNVNSGGTFSTNNTLGATQAVIRSADVALGNAAAIQGTSLNFEVDNAATAINLGGASTSGYSFDAAELARLRSPTTRITVLASAPPVTNIGDLTLQGGLSATPNIQSVTGGLFRIQTPGEMRVNGSVNFINMTDANRVELSADRLIIALGEPGGSVRLLGNTSVTQGIAPANAPLAGQLLLSGGDVIAAEGPILTQLATITDPEERARLLSTPAPLVTPTGSLYSAFEARSISATVSRTFYNQNMGEGGDRAGFRVGAGGMTVQGLGTGTIDYHINLRALPMPATPPGGTTDADGFLINDSTRAAITFNPPSNGQGFTPQSTVNGCTAAGVCIRTGAEPEIPVTALVAAEVQELTEEEKEAAATSESELSIIFGQSLIDTTPVESPAAVTEPVSASGNLDLWVVDAAKGGEPK